MFDARGNIVIVCWYAFINKTVKKKKKKKKKTEKEEKKKKKERLIKVCFLFFGLTLKEILLLYAGMLSLIKLKKKKKKD